MSSPVRSMTGFARVRSETSAGELTISLRSVNHRALDLQFFCAMELAQYENAMRTLLKQHVGRGHVDIRASLVQADGTPSVGINRAVIAQYVRELQALAGQLGLDGKPDLNALLSLPGAVNRGGESCEPGPEFAAELQASFERCLRELNVTREREGGSLRDHIQQEIAGLEVHITGMCERRKQISAALHKRLRARISEILNGAAVSESRLVEEAAILSDKSEIEEELTRLRVHVEELKRITAEGGEVGKKLDFLLQELNRETNTVLAKTGNTGELGLDLTAAGLAVKAHLEKIREQALNLE